jgi:probable metal-binding protein
MMRQETESIHGHEVLNFIRAQGPVSLSQLQHFVHSAFGEQAVFHACAADGMDLNGLLDYLRGRGKIHDAPDGIRFAPDAQLCDHA